MYGFTPMDKFLEVINVKADMQMQANEAIEIFNYFP